MTDSLSGKGRAILVVLGLLLTNTSSCFADDNLSIAQEMFADYRYAAGLAPLREAAEAGNRDARQILGLMLLNGDALYGAEVPTNREEGLRWLRLAAADGCTISQHVLARVGGSRTARTIPARAG